ncbi:MAG TPA: DUF3500 domain-containing protein [Fimbriimonadaceae bacterium]|nr:DUF3500 domain-containing protein [Fimbriimonadaceae bacterium]
MKLGLAIVAMHLLTAQGTRVSSDGSARAFLDTLMPEQRAQAVLAYDHPAKTVWSYTPGRRPGVSWAALSPEQRKAAHELLRASLSSAGYTKIEQIRELEPILREMERGNPGRDPERYWFMFFGEPDRARPWVWRYEGHHLSLTFAYREGRLVSSTPQFLGAHPARAPVAGRLELRPLSKEQDLAFAFMETLTSEERSRAVVAERAPGDILTTNSSRARLDDRSGLPVKGLAPRSREALERLLEAHAEVQSESEQKRRLDTLRREGLDNLVVAWMGPVAKGGRHYYRILGRTLIIEFDCTQDDGNHIHVVWRDRNSDFGLDPLANHYARFHPQGGKRNLPPGAATKSE